MIRFVFTLLPALAWFAAVFAVGSLAWTVLTDAQDRGALEYGVFAIAAAGTGFCLFAAYRELGNALRAHRDNSPFWRPDEPVSAVIGARAGNRYPMSDAQITHVRAVLTALSGAGLIQHRDEEQIGIIAAMENEGYGDQIGAAETMLSLHSVFEDNDLEFDAMLYVHQGVEISNRQIQFLAHELLSLSGLSIAIDNITVDAPESGRGPGRILITRDATQDEIACEFHPKYTPNGLVEGIAGMAAMAGGQNDERLYWESPDGALIIARLTPARAGAFNAVMEALNDRFRFVPVRS